MFARVLPGLRHVRTPLIVGYLWIVIAWLWLYESYPSDGATRYPAFDSLVRFAGRTGMAIALSFIAYLAGSLTLETMTWVRERLNRSELIYSESSVDRLIDRLRIGTRRRIHGRAGVRLYERVDREAASVSFSRLPELGAKEGDNSEYVTRTRDRLKSMGVSTSPTTNGTDPEFRLTQVLAVAWQHFVERARRAPELWDQASPVVLLTEHVLIESESPSMAQRLLVADERIHSEYDRLASESEMRLAIAAPLVILGISIVARVDWGLLSKSLLIAGAAAVSFALWLQGRRIRLQSEAVLIDAVSSGFVNTPTLDLLPAVQAAQAQRDDTN